MHERFQKSPTELCWKRLKYLATQPEGISLFLNVYLLCSFIQCRPSVKKRVKIELRGETLLNHYISLYRGGRGEWVNEKTYAAQSVESRKRHGNRAKKAQSNVTFRRKLTALCLYLFTSLCVWVCKTLLPFFPLLFRPIFLKANFTKISFILGRMKFLSHSFDYDYQSLRCVLPCRKSAATSFHNCATLCACAHQEKKKK